MYDPFVPGRFTVAERSMQAFDAARNRSFPCNIWRPVDPVGICPIILLSHSSGGSGRRAYTFLTNQLASHGYVVVGLNHSELVAPELVSRGGASNPGNCGACARRKFESKARDSAGKAGVQVASRRSDTYSGGRKRRVSSARRHVRDLRKNAFRETHGDSPPRRPYAFHG